MAYKIQLRRGPKNDLPQLDNGEIGYTQDTNQLYIGTTNGNRLLTFDTLEYMEDVDGGVFGDEDTGFTIDGGTF